METLAPGWAHDPYDLSDLREKQQAPPTGWESHCVFSCSPPAGRMWTEQLSPHIQRNKQLRDVLLQREEELLRLQEENNKLREFLSSSFVRNLEDKAKRLSADGRRTLKRSLRSDEESFQACARQLPPQVSKRVCRNLAAEFSSSHTPAVSSETNLDLWVLQTLGLKDRDTIDTSSEYLSSPGHSLGSFDATVSSPSSSGLALNSLSPSAAARCPALHPVHTSNAANSQDADCGHPAGSPQHCPASSGCDVNATPPGGQYEAAVSRSLHGFTHFLSPLMTDSLNSERAESHWPSQRDTQASSEDMVQTIHFSPVLSSSPAQNQPSAGAGGCRPASPSVGSATTPQTPRTDLAFTMSLSPSSSVKTHSFPQGQAFVSKDTGGRWNFTWLPRQGQ